MKRYDDQWSVLGCAFIIGMILVMLLWVCVGCKESLTDNGKASVSDNKVRVLDAVGSRTNAKSKVFEGGFELECFLLSETIFLPIPINAIKFVIKPRCRLAKIGSCDVQPRNVKENVIKPLFHVSNTFHNAIVLYCVFKKNHPPECEWVAQEKDFNYSSSSKSFGKSRNSSNNIRAYNSCSLKPLGNDFLMLRKTSISSASACVKR